MDKIASKTFTSIQGNWVGRNFITASRVNARLITHARSEIYNYQQIISLMASWGVRLTWLDCKNDWYFMWSALVLPHGLKDDECFVCSALVSLHGSKNDERYMCSALVSPHGFKNDECYMCSALVSPHGFKGAMSRGFCYFQLHLLLKSLSGTFTRPQSAPDGLTGKWRQNTLTVPL